MKISIELKRWRKRNGYTFLQASRALNVVPTTVMRWEKGETEPKGVFLDVLLKVLAK